MAAPVVTNVSPVTASSISKSDYLQFDVTCATTIGRVIVTAEFPGIPTEELVLSGNTYTTNYTTNGTVTTITNGFRYRFLRNPCWPDAINLHIFAVNTSGEIGTQTVTYTLSSTDISYPIVSSSSPVFPINNPIIQNIETAITSTRLLALFDRTLEESYIEALKRGGDGYELFQAFSKVFYRVSQAAVSLRNSLLFSQATGGTYATGTVEFYRENDGFGEVTVKRGTIVGTSNNVYFRTTEDAVFGSSDLGPIAVSVKAIYPSPEYNVSGQVTTPSGLVLAGDIDTIYRLIESPDYGDPTIKVRNISATSGGSYGALDMLGADRGMARRSGEQDQQYRLRLRQIADTISPNAIQFKVNEILKQAHGNFDYIETKALSYQTCWDAPTKAATSGVSTTFVYDDTRSTATTMTNRWLDAIEQKLTFIVRTDNLQPIRDFSGFYDDTSGDQRSQLKSPITEGYRCACAYDSDNTDVAFSSGRLLPLAYDVGDPGKDAIYSGMYKTMQDSRAAGIVAILEKKGN